MNSFIAIKQKIRKFLTLVKFPKLQQVNL